MALIKSRNTLHEGVPKTRLTHTEASGVTALRWENPNGFSANWGIQIGERGEEQTEVRILSSATPAGTAGTVTAATDFEHPADTPVYGIKYDQVVFQRSTDGTAGTATSLTNGTITYQADSDVTIFDDTSGSSTYAYRTLFRSSGLSENSTLSDFITFAGFSFYSLGKIRERAKNKLWDASFLTDDTIDEWVNEWKDEMVNEVIQTNEDYSIGTESIGFGTDGLGTITTADFSQLRRVWITYNGVDRFQSTKQNINDFLPNEIFSSSHPFHNFRGDDVVEVKPADSGGTVELTFYRFGTTMVNDTDELPLPMRPYTKSFTDYVVSQALYKDQKDQSADRRMVFANAAKKEFLLNLAPRDKSGPTSIDIVEPISGQDRIIF